MRAVIWTDVFQASVMFLGLFGSAVIGVLKIGSFGKVYDVTTEFKRLRIELVGNLPRICHIYEKTFTKGRVVFILFKNFTLFQNFILFQNCVLRRFDQKKIKKN